MMPRMSFHEAKYKYLWLVLLLIVIGVTVILRAGEASYRMDEVSGVAGYVQLSDSSNRVSALTDAKQTTWDDLGGGVSRLYFRFPSQINLGKAILVFSIEEEAPPGTKIVASISSDNKQISIANADVSGQHEWSYQNDQGPVVTDNLTLTISSNSPVRITDAFFYSASKRSFIGYVLNAVSVFPRSLPAYLFYCLVFICSITATGLLAIRRYLSRFSPIESVAAAFLVGFASMSVAGFLIYVVTLHNQVTQSLWLLLFWLWTAFSLYKTINGGLWRWQPEYKILLPTMILYLLFLLSWYFVFEGGLSGRATLQNDLYFDNSVRYQASIQPYQSDQVFPYNNAKVFYYGGQKLDGDYDPKLSSQLLKSRPQLYPMFAQPFLKAFGDRYFIFNALSISLMPMLILATYLLASVLFNKRGALLAGTLIPTSYYLLFLSDLTQIKYLTVIFVAMYLYFLVKSSQQRGHHYIFLATLAAVVMLLVHYYTVIYIAAGLLFLWMGGEMSWKRLLTPTVVPFIALIAWLKIVGGSSGAEFISSVATGTSPTLLTRLANRYDSIIGLFLANPFPSIWNRMIGYYKLTLPGMTSFSLLAAFVYTLSGNYKKLRAVWLALIVLPILLTIIGNGDYTLFGLQLYFVGFVPLIYAIVALGVVQMDRKKQLTILGLIYAEWLFITFWYYRGEVAVPLLQGLSSHSSLATLILFVLVASILGLGYMATSTVSLAKGSGHFVGESPGQTASKASH